MVLCSKVKKDGLRHACPNMGPKRKANDLFLSKMASWQADRRAAIQRPLHFSVSVQKIVYFHEVLHRRSHNPISLHQGKIEKGNFPELGHMVIVATTQTATSKSGNNLMGYIHDWLLIKQLEKEISAVLHPPGQPPKEE